MKLRVASAALVPLVLLITACKSGDPEVDSKPKPDPAMTVKTPTTAPPPAAAKNARHVDFDPKIAWKSWDEAQAAAKSSNKAIMLVLYADWCPHCRELAPVFSDGDVQKLSEGLVMVHQNSDEDPPWLKRYASVGSYVPRILFVGPDGTLKTDLTSGNGRFPYFYTPQGIESLKTSMRRASGG